MRRFSIHNHFRLFQQTSEKQPNKKINELPFHPRSVSSIHQPQTPFRVFVGFSTLDFWKKILPLAPPLKSSLLVVRLSSRHNPFAALKPPLAISRLHLPRKRSISRQPQLFKTRPVFISSRPKFNSSCPKLKSSYPKLKSSRSKLKS